MSWDFYLTVKVGGIAVFIFAGGAAASKALALDRSKTYFINACAAITGYLVSTSWYIIQHLFGSEEYEFLNIFQAWDEAGSVLYGWVIGGTLALIALTKIFKIKTVRYLDAVLPWMLVAQFLNRLGCADAGCCFGKLLSPDVYFPVQLVEAFYDLALFFFIRSRPRKEGEMTFLYFTGYATARFFFEFLRGDNGPALLFMTVPQVTSLLILLVVISSKKKIIA
jgi:phosphatidylglycerol---prolipoprotein diacylglyceryl transferase